MERSQRLIHDGETVKFTDAAISGADAKFTLNYDPTFKILFSQLAAIFFDKPLKYSDNYIPRVIFKNGETLDLLPYDVNAFWDKVKGKSFHVTVKAMAKLNIDSTAEIVKGKSLEEKLKIVQQLIANKEFDLIKSNDLLVDAPMYELTEV